MAQWSVVDPGAGSPTQIASLAGSLAEVADVAGQARDQLVRLGEQVDGGVWRGEAADAFRDRIAKLPAHLDKLAASYQAAAEGLRAYSAAVDDIGVRAQSVTADVTAATSDVGTATSQQAGYITPDPTTGASTVNPYDVAVEEARARLARARTRLHSLAEDRTGADTRVGAALHDAHQAGMRNKPWYRHALRVVSHALTVITIVLIAVAIVAVLIAAIFCPLLIPALIAAATAAGTTLGAAQLAVDGVRKATGDEQVSWTDLAIDTLGVIPYGKALGPLLHTSSHYLPTLTLATETASRYLTRATTAIRASTRYAGAFARSATHDLRTIRVAVRVAVTDTGLGFPVLVREGKTAGQMLHSAREAGRAAASLRGVSGDGFVVIGSNSVHRKIRWRPHAVDPDWGLSHVHVAKHLWGDTDFALKQVDPHGSPEKWLSYLQDLGQRRPSVLLKKNIVDILGVFPKTGGGTFMLGVRLSPRPDGEWDLVTILTKQ